MENKFSHKTSSIHYHGTWPRIKIISLKYGNAYRKTSVFTTGEVKEEWEYYFTTQLMVFE